jgi:hypothetical protein
MVFSSNRPDGNLGNFDLYETTRTRGRGQYDDDDRKH